MGAEEEEDNDLADYGTSPVANALVVTQFDPTSNAVSTFLNGTQKFSHSPPKAQLNASTAIHLGGGGDLSQPDAVLMREALFTNAVMSSSTVTALKPNELVEWRHPFGHRWRWAFEELSPTSTRVTETFDYRDCPIKNKLKYYERTGFRKSNGTGIEATLTKLHDGLEEYLAGRALQAAKLWRFEPAREHGKPVVGTQTIHFVFTK